MSWLHCAPGDQAEEERPDGQQDREDLETVERPGEADGRWPAVRRRCLRVTWIPPTVLATGRWAHAVPFRTPLRADYTRPNQASGAARRARRRLTASPLRVARRERGWRSRSSAACGSTRPSAPRRRPPPRAACRRSRAVRGRRPAYSRIRSPVDGQERGSPRRSRRRGCSPTASCRARAAKTRATARSTSGSRAGRRWSGRRRTVQAKPEPARRRRRDPTRRRRRDRSERTMTPVSWPISPYGNDSRRTTSTTCSEPRSPSGTVVRPPRRATRCGVTASIRMSSRAVTLDRDVAGHDLERLAHLRGDGVADLRRVGDVVEVAAAGIGEVWQQSLVEVVADAERRGRDATRPERRRVRARARPRR